MKQLLKRLLTLLHVSVTRNQKYDAFTRKIIHKTLRPDSNCIDIGCHKGEILDLMIKGAPQGKKFGFEPIPELFHILSEKYRSDPTVNINPTALYDKTGTTSFQHVLNAPAYSGIKKRKYDGKNVHIEQISVKTGLLDDIIPEGTSIDIIKIDVEGAEFQVMKGALATLKRCKPVVIFEFGMGAADFYGSTPDLLHRFISVDCGMKISTLKGFLSNGPSLTIEKFKILFEKGKEYYFVAHP
ncbi:MAG: FkbM family methyltransferase [Bacteroidales bacterium]|jgi:FkbM family methyltransferase|nr:FkbM family methyltransferase [Bacteroidales bacterium]